MSDFEYTHLVTGSQGGSSPHVTAACDAARNAAIAGQGTYRFGIYERCEVAYQGGNDFRVGRGFLLFQGRQVEVPENGVLLTAQNGDQGKLRHDLIVSGYEQADEGGSTVERSYLRYIKGTPSESDPEDPACIQGDLFAGAVKAETPLARIRWDGLTLKGVDMVPPVGATVDPPPYEDGIWTVSRRSDGSCVCEGMIERSATIGTGYVAGIYFGDFLAPAFPQGLFAAPPRVTASVHDAPSTVWLATSSGQKPTASAPQTVRLMSGNKEVGIPVTVAYRAVGAAR